MNNQSSNADEVFARKNFHFVEVQGLDEASSGQSTQLISAQKRHSQEVAIDIAKLCARASSMRFSGNSLSPAQ